MIFTHDSDYEVISFAVDEAYRTEEKFCDLPILSFEQMQAEYSSEKVKIFVAVSVEN